MSISVECGAVNVFVAGRHDSGFPNGVLFNELEELRDEVVATDPGFTELVVALDATIAEPGLHNKIIEKRRKQGQFLIGISTEPGFDMYNLGGLLYAEGSKPNPDKSFSVVRMGTWIRQSKVLSHMQERMRKSLIDMSLQPVGEHIRFGVPVNRLTKVEPLHPYANEKPFVFGHVKELEAVAGLEVPERLKNLLAFVTRSWHGSEHMNGGEADFLDVRNDLHEVWFEDQVN
jgi:hypothetical protein